MAALQRLRASGFEVRHTAMGPTAKATARVLRGRHIPTAIGDLAPDWRTADALSIGG
jgi:hypothetical protein